ncbi:DUF58 domain-containing protein [Mycetocola manganoxydans]|uniref:DUF58 domain-containing protein n=1 Tax=Mycetocola manganoxydans TaxID=699879 RepID=UPI000EF62FE3|nr:DUF58 domain-containing protein [Mycetocola manganoxydans]GHD38569.1 membrane protein [Mycetocola manganoxydans]
MASQSGRFRAVRPTVRGWGVLFVGSAVLIAATVVDRREGLFLFLFLVLLFTGSAVYVRTHRPRMSATRTFTPASVSVGEPALVRTVVETRDEDIAAIASWRDEVPPVFARTPSGELPRRLPGAVRGYRALLEYELRSGSRGRYFVGPFRVRHGDPFGLVTTERRIADPQPLVVTPRVTDLSDAGLRSASGDGAQHDLSHLTTQRADELIAREYRPGDPLRRVHWRQTARRGELMVRQEEQEGDPEATLLLDTALTTKGSAAGATSSLHFERMVELTASIGIHLLDSGYAISLVESATDAVPLADGTVPFRISRFASGDSGGFLETLADAERFPVPELYDVSAGLHQVIGRTGTVMPVFAVLGRVSQLGARRLASAKVNASPAVVFLTRSLETARARDVDELTTLSDAGWRAVLADEQTSVEAAWTRVAFGDATVAARGGDHVRR